MIEFLAHHKHLASIASAMMMLCMVIAIMAPLETFFSVRRLPVLGPQWGRHLCWYGVNVITASFLLGIPSVGLAMMIARVEPEAWRHSLDSLPLGLRMVLAMMVGEIGYYWDHRWSHEWPWLWRFHAIHHKPTELSFMINTYGHPVDVIFTRLCGTVLLFATGLVGLATAGSMLTTALVVVIGGSWSYLIHANTRLRLGPLEYVIASPFFHHWHHTYEDHKDRNFAAMVPLADIVFGTFYRPKAWPEAYGTATELPGDIASQILFPFFPQSFSKSETARQA